MGDERTNGRKLRVGKSDVRLDAVAVQQGREVQHPQHEGFSVFVLPAADFNPRYREAVQNAALESGLDEDKARAHFAMRYDDPEFVVDALVGKMTGIYDENGEELPYTRALGLEVLASPDFADLRGWIVGQAMRTGLFYTRAVEAEAGN